MRSSVRDVSIGCVAGDGLEGKGYTSKLWQGNSEAQKPAWMGCAGSLMPEMKHNQQCVYWAAQRSSNTGYSQPRHLPIPEPAIRAFHITVNSSLLQSASSESTKL